LLAGLHNDARCLELDQGVVGLGLVLRDVDDQPGRLEAVQEGVDLATELEEAAVVAGDGGPKEIQGLDDFAVMSFGIVPDNQAMVRNLPGNQAANVFGDDTHILRPRSVAT
jgi:hypothetical protein